MHKYLFFGALFVLAAFGAALPTVFGVLFVWSQSVPVSIAFTILYALCSIRIGVWLIELGENV